MAKDNTEYNYLNEVPKQSVPGPTKKIGMFFPEELTLIRDRTHYLYDPRVENNFDDDIVKGIMEIGLSKSIDAQKIRMDDGTCILAVTDGRQGVINTIEANRRLVERGDKPIKIKVEVREEDEVLAIRRMTITNEHRVPDDPVTKGFKAKRLKDRGVPVELLCQDFRCVPETLSNWIKLTELCVHVQKLVQQDKMAMTAALKLRTLSPTEQKEKADEIVAGTKKSKRGAGTQHTGVDRRRIKKIYEIAAPKNDVAKMIFKWLVGEADDDSVSELIDFSLLKKDADSGSGDGDSEPKKRGRKKKLSADDEQETLGRIFGNNGKTAGLFDDDGLEDELEDTDLNDLLNEDGEFEDDD